MDKLQHQLGFLTEFSLVDLSTRWAPTSPAFQDPRGLGRIAIAGVFLGITTASSLFLAFLFPSLWRFFIVVFFSCIYHFSEFAMTAFGHPLTVTYDSFLFAHSFEYSLARLLYNIEFFIWYFLAPSISTHPIGFTISMIGLIGMIIGQAIRTLAMFQAGESFTHQVATTHRSQHILVTNGLYRYFRHPSYFGWFLWVVSLQIFMLNPFFLIGTIALSYSFFADRIPYEEDALIEFFGDQYKEYRARTPTWIPFIR